MALAANVLQPQARVCRHHHAADDGCLSHFLGHGNEPLSAVELGARLHRSPALILRTIGGLQVYNGIKPVTDGSRRGPRPKVDHERVDGGSVGTDIRR